MLAMQYTIQLPHDFAGGDIQARVAQRAPLFDGLAGMRHKSFLYNDTDKLYAPFYIWEDLAKAREFLMQDLFMGVVQSFRRPRVRTWMVLGEPVTDTSIHPTYALREADLIEPEEQLAGLAEKEREAQAKLAETAEGLAMHMVALDPDRWEIIRFSLWRDQPSAIHSGADCLQSYDVLHVSQP